MVITKVEQTKVRKGHFIQPVHGDKVNEVDGDERRKRSLKISIHEIAADLCQPLWKINEWISTSVET